MRAKHHAGRQLGQLVRPALDYTERFLEFVLRPGVVEPSTSDVGDEVGRTFEVDGDMGAEQHRMLAVLDVGMQHVHEFVAGEHVESAGRLVEDEQFGVMAQRDGEHQLHLHAPRKVLDLLLAVLSSPETEIVQVPPIPIPVPCRVERGDDALDLRDLPLFVQVAGVEHDAQLFLDGLLVNDVVEAEHLDAAVVPSDHVEDQLDQRGFSGAVRADQPHDVALGQVEGHVVQHEAGVVVLGDTGDRKGHRVGFGYGGHDHGPFLGNSLVPWPRVSQRRHGVRRLPANAVTHCLRYSSSSMRPSSLSAMSAALAARIASARFSRTWVSS